MDVIVLDCAVRESGSMVFFLSFVLGYMVEDGVQAVWRKLQGSQDAGSSSGKEPEVWKKALGYVWVSTFLTVMSAVYFEPVRKRPERQVGMIPWSVAEVIGVEVMGGWLLWVGWF